MNILLTIGIFLQIYQIYRTPTYNFSNNNKSKSQVFLQQPGSSSFYDVQKSLGDSVQNRLQLQEPISMYQEKAFLEPFQNTDDANYNPRTGRLRSRLMLSSGDNEYVPDLRPDTQPPELEQTRSLNVDDDALNNSNRTDDAYTPFQYPKYNYSLPAQKTNWTLTTQPNPSNESKLAVIVISGRSNFERRQTIRETWAQNHTNVYFIVGGPEPDNLQDKDWNNINSTSNRLFREQETYQDILDTIHPDTYKGLCYKVHYAIQWISQHPAMKHIQWILKADDDVVVRQNALQHYVLRKFHPQMPMVIGRIEANSKPHRMGKWAEDPKWVGIEGVNEYPPWAYGSTGYVMSRPVLDYVASEKSLYYYQGEDASLGIWLYESPLDVSWIDSPAFNLDEQVLWKNHHEFSAVIGHDLSTEAMRAIYEKWKDPKKLEENLHKDHVRVKGTIYRMEQRIIDDEDMLWNDDRMYWEHENFDHYLESRGETNISSSSRSNRRARREERMEERRREQEKEWDKWAEQQYMR